MKNISLHDYLPVVHKIIISMLLLTGCLSAQENIVKNAEEAGWELAFKDDFNREKLGTQWDVLDGKWRIENGTLSGNGVIITKRSFPERDKTGKIYPGGFALGYIRMEFDITLLKKLPEIDISQKPDKKGSDSGCFINARYSDDADKTKIEPGYLFELGGLYGAHYRVTKPKHRTTVGEAEPEVGGSKKGKTCRIIAENDEGVVRLFVDGKAIIEKKEMFSIMGSGFDKIGFELKHPFCIDNVMVYVKALPGGLDRDELRTK